jgi:3' terminal RNA ribose 2'-O-methyltransferase Hen1
MLLTITTTHSPATDLGYLLHKNPAVHHVRDLAFGKVHLFYPEASAERCTAALLLDVDPVSLVRGRQQSAAKGPLAQYVNDRPYVASSFLSVALAELFGTAMGGRSKERPELAEVPLPLAAELATVPCRGGEELLRRLFEPLGYTVTATRHPLDDCFPEWGPSPYYRVHLQGLVRVCDLLTHLYVLVPVLDDEKHYWVGDNEVDKLLRCGATWLAAHPERDLIATRYLKHRQGLAREALSRLLAEELPTEIAGDDTPAAQTTVTDEPPTLNAQRLEAVVTALRAADARRVLDLGCGEGRLLQLLLADARFTEIVGMDVSCRALEIAAERLHLDPLPPLQRERLRLIQGSLTYRDARLAGFDAAALVEVIEHLDTARLGACERVLFEFTRPETVVVTTPNAEYNAKWEGLPEGGLRHTDHRFEWTRAEFQSWAAEVARRHGYSVAYQPVGPEDPVVGAPTQLGVFTREP